MSYHLFRDIVGNIRCTVLFASDRAGAKARATRTKNLFLFILDRQAMQSAMNCPEPAMVRDVIPCLNVKFEDARRNCG
jgi:hypothetical protein